MEGELAKLQELIREKKKVLEQVDRELLGELEKEKLLKELVVDLSLSSALSSNSESRSSNDSKVSSSSINTEFVLGEIKKAQLYMNNLRQSGKCEDSPSDTQFVEPLPSKKRSFPSKVRDNLMTTRLKPKQELGKSDYQISKQQSFDLQQFSQKQLKEQYEQNQQTITNMAMKRQLQQQMLTLKQTWRQESLALQREQIRQQLLAEERNKQSPQFQTIPIFPSPSFSKNYQVTAKDHLHMTQRNSRIQNIFKDLDRARVRGERLKKQINNYVLYR